MEACGKTPSRSHTATEQKKLIGKLVTLLESSVSSEDCKKGMEIAVRVISPPNLSFEECCDLWNPILDSITSEKKRRKVDNLYKLIYASRGNMNGDGEKQLSKSLEESSVEIEMTTNPAKASRVPLSNTRRTLSVVRRFLHRNSPGKLAVDKTKYKKLFQAVDNSNKDYVSTFSFMSFLKLNKLNTPENMEKTHHGIHVGVSR